MTEDVKLPRTIFTVKSYINSQIDYRHKIEIADSRNMRICRKTKPGVLNPTLWSEISHEERFKNCFAIKVALHLRWFTTEHFQNHETVKGGVYQVKVSSKHTKKQ